MGAAVAHLLGVNAGTRIVTPVSESDTATVPSGLMLTTGSIVWQAPKRAQSVAMQLISKVSAILFMVYGAMSVRTFSEVRSYSMIANVFLQVPSPPERVKIPLLSPCTNGAAILVVLPS